MADQREAILARLVAICGGVSGIAAVGRNRLDVAGLVRPAVVVLDGIEQFRDAPIGPTIDMVQRMELTPGIVLAVRGDDGAEAGALMTKYRNAILAAILNDSALAASVTTNGGMRYEGCSVAMPDAEAKEHRMDINVMFTYLFRVGDL